MNTALKGNSILEKKIVSISSKRQITIPQKFFTMLGFTNEAECMVRGNELVIRPARQYAGGEFAVGHHPPVWLLGGQDRHCVLHTMDGNGDGNEVWRRCES